MFLFLYFLDVKIAYVSLLVLVFLNTPHYTIKNHHSKVLPPL